MVIWLYPDSLKCRRENEKGPDGPVLSYIGWKPLAGDGRRSGRVLEQCPENGLQRRVGLDCGGQGRQVDLALRNAPCGRGRGSLRSAGGFVFRDLTFGFCLVGFESMLGGFDFRNRVREFRTRKDLDLASDVGDVLAERVELFLCHIFNLVVRLLFLVYGVNIVKFVSFITGNLWNFFLQTAIFD